MRSQEGFFSENEREFGKNAEVMSILMYDSINQQCLVNRGGGKGPVGNLLIQASGWRQNLSAEQWVSLYSHLWLSLTLFAASASSQTGMNSRRQFIRKQALCLFAGEVLKRSVLTTLSSPSPSHVT